MILLNMYYFFIASTYCFFDEVFGLVVADLMLEEEVIVDVFIVVVVNMYDEVCVLFKIGNGVLSEDLK